MEIRPLRYGCLALEIFKTVNNLNPYYMKEIFSKTKNVTHRPLDINFNQNNIIKYGSNSLQSLGPHICNSLPREIKKEMDYKKFKNYMDNWLGLKCKWNMCSFLNVYINNVQLLWLRPRIWSVKTVKPSLDQGLEMVFIFQLCFSNNIS